MSRREAPVFNLNAPTSPASRAVHRSKVATTRFRTSGKTRNRPIRAEAICTAGRPPRSATDPPPRAVGAGSCPCSDSNNFTLSQTVDLRGNPVCRLRRSALLDRGRLSVDQAVIKSERIVAQNVEAAREDDQLISVLDWRLRLDLDDVFRGRSTGRTGNAAVALSAGSDCGSRRSFHRSDAKWRGRSACDEPDRSGS